MLYPFTQRLSLQCWLCNKTHCICTLIIFLHLILPFYLFCQICNIPMWLFRPVSVFIPYRGLGLWIWIATCMRLSFCHRIPFFMYHVNYKSSWLKFCDHTHFMMIVFLSRKLKISEHQPKKFHTEVNAYYWLKNMN